MESMGYNFRGNFGYSAARKTRVRVELWYSWRTMAINLPSNVKAALSRRVAELAESACIDPADVAAIAKQAGVTHADIIAEWTRIAFADPNEIVSVRRSPCRHCHGVGHRYQWTQAEYESAVEDATANGKASPDGLGGFGYDLNAQPNPECPECNGNGVAGVFVADTGILGRHPLYAGAKVGRRGIEVKLRDQDAALLNIARYLGMMVDKREISGPGGAPIATSNITAADLSDDQLAAILGAHGVTE